MKITNVQGHLMSFPMPERIDLPFWGGLRTISKRDAMLIKVSTDVGLVGYAPGPAFSRASDEIRSTISQFLFGKDPLRWKNFHFEGHPDTVKTYHAVEVALLDLAGKYEGCSISELMGGRKRSKIKLYGSAGMYMSSGAYAEEASAIQRMGFPGYKMRLAAGPDEDLRTLERMRAATGPEMKLMVDAHTWWRMGDKSYSLNAITDLARSMRSHDPYWLEEPLLPEDHSAYRQLRLSNHLPLASGEHEQNFAGFQDLADKEAVDFLQMDVCCQGGFSMGLKVFDLAARHKIKFAFHSWGTMLEVLAAAQLGVCRDESVVEWLEYPCYAAPGKAGMYPFPIANEILHDELEIEHGYLKVPADNGLGIEVNEGVIEKYPFIPGPWSLFHQTSPRATIAVTGDHSVKWEEQGTANGEQDEAKGIGLAQP